MSLVFNMVGGGGGSAELPAIYVTYPEGSVCTCSNGSKTYTAKNTSGYWLFAGLEVGEWTVTISDPTGTYGDRSTTATITDAGEIVNLKLVYRLYLYNLGDECSEISGGWGIENWGSTFISGVKEETYMVMNGTASKHTLMGTANVIEFNSYSKLYATLNSISTLDTYDSMAIQIVDDSLNPWVVLGVTQRGEQTVDIPLSGISQGRVGFYVGGNSAYRNTISAVWLD